LTCDQAIIIPAQALSGALIVLLKVILNQLKDFNAEIAALFETLSDAQLFSDLPGAGSHIADTISDSGNIPVGDRVTCIL